jgi:exodeoxyribonuclease-3
LETSRTTENDIKNWRGNVKKSGSARRTAVAHRAARRGLGRRGSGPRRARAVLLVVAAGTARMERASAYALRWSDHAPVTVEYR